MTPRERIHLVAEAFLPPLHRTVRRRLLEIVNTGAEILDVGGRRSPYTIAVPGQIVVTDLPQESETQRQLGLGLTARDLERLRRQRSNIAQILFDDMTHSSLRDQSFDCVVAVEVLEHVEDDRSFVHEVSRILRPSGTFLATTPNGDWVPNTNPDHKRHYTRTWLSEVLSECFGTVSVEYAIRDSRARTLGLRSFSTRRPVQTLVTMGCNVVNSWQSSPPRLKTQAVGTRHLIATAQCPIGRR
jgi:SAM-dependent methyltransferase